MTVREIQGHLEELYQVDVSPDLISHSVGGGTSSRESLQRGWSLLRSSFGSPRTVSGRR